MYRMLDLSDGDQAEFLSRKVQQYEETLRVMYQRVMDQSISAAPWHPQPGQLRGICLSCQSRVVALANLARPGGRAFAYPGVTAEKSVDVFLSFNMYFNLKSHNFEANSKEHVLIVASEQVPAPGNLL